GGGASIAVRGLRDPPGARLRAAFRRLPASAAWWFLRPPLGDRDLGERARIRQAEDHLSSIPKRQRSEQDTPLQELPDRVVPERLAAVFPPENERAAVTPAGAAKTALPLDDRSAAARAVPEPGWINRSRFARADDVARVLDDLRHELARVELPPLDLLEFRLPLARKLGGFQGPVPDQGHEVTAEVRRGKRLVHPHDVASREECLN